MKLGAAAAIFRSAIGQLTLWYMAIIMAISLIFSLAVYKASARELDSGLRRQAKIYQGLPRFLNQPTTSSFPLPEEQLAAGLRHLKVNLFILNLAILALAGAASYWLAKVTLSPIEEALEAQGRFTADASHELRTPLTAMKTEIEVALRDTKLSSADARQLLQSNLEEISKLEALSNGLLKLAQGDGYTFSNQIARLTDVIAEAIDRLATLLKSQNTKVVSKVGDLKITGDHDSLVELLVILLDNAIKYSPPNTTVNITARRHGHFVDLSIADQGQGIKASDLPHIFDRFYRADSSRTKGRTSGYGLGLSIAQKIAEAHHGKITAVSQPGKGSTFTIKLPLAETKKSLKPDL